MTQKNSGFEIKAEQRQSWLSIAMVWAGGMICVPCLMIGGVLVSGGLSFGQIIASILLGYGILQVGLSLQSHDPSQRSNGILTIAGGIVITFTKEILTLITGG